MTNFDSNLIIIFRLDAGNKFGLGHLSRCLALAQELVNLFKITIIAKTDDKVKVENFIKSNFSVNTNTKILFLESNISLETDIESIVSQTSNSKSFLILDHYSITKEYQNKLNEHNVKWLQFDSHAKQDFYGDIVLHASPAATDQLYNPLQKNPKTRFLLGTTYAIVSKKYKEERNRVKPRSSLNHLLICFGGGDDKGATLQCLKHLDEKIISSINIVVVTSNTNRYLPEIELLIKDRKNIQLVLNANDLEKLMAHADLGIIASGTLSYEAACLGLPMMLITIAENQQVNAKGWIETGCAIGLGPIEDLTKDIVTNSVNTLLQNPSKLETMSKKAFKSVDGLGASRVMDEIISIL